MVKGNVLSALSTFGLEPGIKYIGFIYKDNHIIRVERSHLRSRSWPDQSVEKCFRCDLTFDGDNIFL